MAKIAPKYTSKKFSRLKKATELPDARIGLCKKLGIDPKRLKEPLIKKLFDQYFADVREIFTTPIPPEKLLPPRRPGSVGGCTVANRIAKPGETW